MVASSKGSMMSFKYALQEKFQAGKASKRSCRIACEEAAGGSLLHQCPWLFAPTTVRGLNHPSHPWGRPWKG